MPRPISVQLYSVREEAKRDGLAKVLERIAAIGYAGVEFAGYGGLQPADLKKVLDGLGLKASGAHTGAFDPAKHQETVDAAKALGLTAVGSGFGPKDFETEDTIKAAADRANAAIERLGAAGLSVYLHNHWWEWEVPAKGDLFLKLCPKIMPQVDVYWVATAKQCPASVITRYAQRIHSLHLKDGPCEKGVPQTAVGQGKVDMKAVVAAGDKSTAAWYVVELDACATDMFTAVEQSYQYLTKNKLATGRK